MQITCHSTNVKKRIATIKTNNMKKAFVIYGLVLMTTAFAFDMKAQSSQCFGMSVSGNSSFPYTGGSRNITINRPSGCSGSISIVTSQTWVSVSGSGTFYTLTAPATSSSRSASFQIRVNGTTVSGFSISQDGPPAPSTPATPTIANNNCGEVRLSRGSPPSGVTWYWQGTNSNGTSTANSSTTYTVSATGRYYLRARSSGGVWSTSSSSVNVSSITQFTAGSISGAQTICAGGDPGTITNTASAVGNGFNNYQWQIATSENGSYSNISGATGTSYNPPVLTSTRWYRRRVNSCGGQNKYSNKIRILVNPAPSTASGSNRERCGPGTLTLTASPGSNGNTIRWYSASSGGTLLRTGTSYTTPSLSSSRTYYAESYNSSTGCSASSRRAITATILSTVGNATGQNEARCESGTLTLTASPGSNGNTIRWYSSSTGGSSLATGTTYTTPSLTSTTTYYAESYNSTTGCFASARTAIVAEISPVLTVATGSGGSRCGTGSVTLSASPGTNGNTIRWYATASGGSVLATGTAFTTPSISVNTTYYAETYNTTTTCSAASRTPVLAEVNIPENWYLDADGDGYAVSVTANCGSPGAGYTNTVLPVDDCNDDPAADGQLYNPDTIWYADENEDGFADSGAETRQQCEKPSGNWTLNSELAPCGVSDTIRQALVDFYNATGGTTWVNSTNWNTEVPVCDWFGVTVVDGELVNIQLPNNNVIGTLPESIGNLIDLNLLDLSNNGIQGGLPPSLGSLLDLDVLLLPNNGLTGELPPALGSLSNLTRMDLSNNNLESQIPISFCNLTNVTDLNLSNNGLFGSIPTQFELMASLVRLDLSNNQLTGRLPSQLTRLGNLREIAVQNNQLSGSIPFSGTNSGLTLFTFQNNRFIFSDFESRHNGYTGTLATYEYTPQANTDTESTVSVTLGNDITLSTDLNSSNNSYVWYKASSPDEVIPDAVGNELLIEDATAEDAGTYYFIASNSTVQGLELTRNSITLNVITTCDVNQSERQALITLYNATGGANWNNTTASNQIWGITNTNSLVCDWYGVTVVDNSVTEIVLPNNNINGNLPDVFAAFPSLERVDFSGNDLSGFISGRFTGILSLNQLALENNKYIFTDLESDFTTLFGQLGANFTFSPQANVDEAEQQTAEAGETITLSSTVLNSSNNQYQWFKDGLPLDGETNKDLILSNVTTTDNGGYHFSATNSVVTGLDLEREMIMLEVSAGNDACGVSDLERNALIALYNALDGPNWTVNTNWNTSAPVCDWYGVVTDVDANVTGLALANNGLRGEIPNSLSQLGSLTSIDLQQNSIIGQIPDNIGALANLQYLLLNDNILVGAIPLSVGNLSALSEFDIANNRIAGALPDTMGGMQQLQYFDANDNKLVQSIPTSLYSIPGLIRFNVSNNQMNGSISSAIGNLSQLEEFWLANNDFGGELPETISTIPALRSVRLNNNAFRGDIPLLIPDFNVANTEVAIEYNNFVFSNFEAEYPAYLNGLDIFTYDPQALVDRQETIRVLENDDVTLGTEDLSSPNNTYVWYKDGVEIPGETGSSLTITDFDPVADTGEYWFVASNTVIDVLQLTRRKINLLERVLLPLDALSLVATCSDNPTNLRNWEVNNPNGQNVPINWQVVGTSQSGTLMAAPGITRFTTNTEVGDNTVQIAWQDTDGTDQTTETISTTETCTPATECTDLLSSIADGSFETAVGASTQARNATFEVSGWSVAQGDPDTFATPFVNSGDPYLFNSFMASPDGGNCFGALRVGNTAEAITTTVNGLVPGTTYVVQFYQANATNLLDTRIVDQAFGSWEVQASGEQLESNPMTASTRNVRWQRALLEFTASAGSTTLRFAPQATANDPSNSYPVYMLLDGVRVYEKPTDPFTTACYGIETQVFCNNAEDNPPIVGDLAPPQGSSTFWYADPVGGIPYSTSDILYDLEPILWADSGSGSRIAVEVIFDLGAPEALEYQTFDLNENPTLADVTVTGINITWHSSFFDSVELPLNTSLTDEQVYYAAQDGNFCRVPVLVNIEIPVPIGSTFQEFCSSAEPTVDNLAMQPTNPAYTIDWYDSSEGGSPLNGADLLVNGATYYAVQTNGSDFSENRLPVRVSVIDEEANAKIYEWDVLFPDGSTVSDITTYYRLDESTVWYNQAFGGSPYFETTNLSAGNTYYARIDEGLCAGLRVLAITVELDDITEPDLVTCIKFVPQPGREYVVSGWVREEALTAQPAGTIEFNLDDSAKEAVLALFNSLTNTIVGEVLEIPSQFVVKDLFPELDMSAVLPYLKDFAGNNVTVYDFRFEKENIDGLERSIGYSFALDPSGTNRMEYRTPQVVLSFGSIFGIPLDFGLGYNYPILNYENLEIEHHSVSIIPGDRLRVNSSFLLDLPEDSVLKGTYANYDTDGAANSGIEGTTEIFDYIENPDYSVINYDNTSIQLEYKDIDGNPINLADTERVLEPKGAVIDGWQRISNVFRIPAQAAYMRMNLITDLDGTNAYFDDVRMHPIDSNVKSFVYNPVTQRLQAELDENNYATYYEYDTEGGLVRVKKETERGIYTIQETRSGNSKLNGSR